MTAQESCGCEPGACRFPARLGCDVRRALAENLARGALVHGAEGHVCSWACEGSDPLTDLREAWARGTSWDPGAVRDLTFRELYGLPQALPPPGVPLARDEGWRFVAGPGYLFTGPLGDGSPRSKWKARWWRARCALRRLWRRSDDGDG